MSQRFARRFASSYGLFVFLLLANCLLCISFQFVRPNLVRISSFSKIRGNHNDGSDNNSIDLWVAGAGTLGELICSKYKSKYRDAMVVAETASALRYPQFVAANLVARQRKDRKEKDGSRS